MTELTAMALSALSRDAETQSKIVIPEWSKYNHLAKLGQLIDESGSAAALIEDWAKALEVDPEVVRVIVNGEVLVPRIDLLTKLAEHIGCDLSELVVPFEAWYSQITLAESRKIQALSEGDEQKAMCYTIIRKLMDKDGKPVFTVEHLPSLLKAPAMLIASIAQRITQRPTLKEQVKNS